MTGVQTCALPDLPLRTFLTLKHELIHTSDICNCKYCNIFIKFKSNREITDLTFYSAYNYTVFSISCRQKGEPYQMNSSQHQAYLYSMPFSNEKLQRHTHTHTLTHTFLISFLILWGVQSIHKEQECCRENKPIREEGVVTATSVHQSRAAPLAVDDAVAHPARERSA